MAFCHVAKGGEDIISIVSPHGVNDIMNRPGFAARRISTFLSMDRGNSGFKIFRGQFKLTRLSLLGFTSEGRLPEGGNQFLKSLDPVILAQITRLRSHQHGF